ncbi:helix-turn-helix transcriptional regulator [Dysgonomonas sp. GY75]|uniref:helix-turn-helix domain-containing protein n=1 Tax=Dysgonomonas sp. GY75 TaxID=2780419 RepID=UPI001883DB0F|nr:helix-turn-helix transcriptional regulator [Dysgonomonas sp. GY75]MBF0651256.1 helix-turn-helix transcriptional regulator [Dysgonomonas sp. GY75]
MNKLRIQEVLDKYNISAAELGRRIGVSRSSITNTINNGNPGVQMLLKWAESIGCSASEFLEDECHETNTITCPKCGTRLEVKEKE